MHAVAGAAHRRMRSRVRVCNPTVKKEAKELASWTHGLVNIAVPVFWWLSGSCSLRSIGFSADGSAPAPDRGGLSARGLSQRLLTCPEFAPSNGLTVARGLCQESWRRWQVGRTWRTWRSGRTCYRGWACCWRRCGVLRGGPRRAARLLLPRPLTRSGRALTVVLPRHRGPGLYLTSNCLHGGDPKAGRIACKVQRGAHAPPPCAQAALVALAQSCMGPLLALQRAYRREPVTSDPKPGVTLGCVRRRRCLRWRRRAWARCWRCSARTSASLSPLTLSLESPQAVCAGGAVCAGAGVHGPAAGAAARVPARGCHL